MRISTQKYIAKCVYIFFCICEDVSVKLSVVIKILCHLRLLAYLTIKLQISSSPKSSYLVFSYKFK